MKIPPPSILKESIKTNIKIINKIKKQSGLNDIRPIKNYEQYLKEYGLK
jgi:hypothetical protein